MERSVFCSFLLCRASQGCCLSIFWDKLPPLDSLRIDKTMDGRWMIKLSHYVDCVIVDRWWGGIHCCLWSFVCISDMVPWRWLSYLEDPRQITGFPQLICQSGDDVVVCLAAGECRVKWGCLGASARRRLGPFFFFVKSESCYCQHLFWCCGTIWTWHFPGQSWPYVKKCCPL